MKWPVVSATLLLMLLVSCKTTPPAAQYPEFVLVPNPGFEAPQEDWIQNWPLIMGEERNAARDAKVFHTGSASLRISGYAWVASQFLPYNGEEIQLSAWMKTENVRRGREAWARCAVTLNGYDEARRPLTSRDLARLDGTNAWRKFEMHTLLSSAVRYVRVVCLVDRDAAGTAWFDDIDLSLRNWRVSGSTDLIAYDENRCEVEVAADKPAGPLNRAWSGADVGPADSLLREPTRAALASLRAAGIDLLRLREVFVGLKIYSEDARGNPRYDWSRLDRALELPVKLGFRLVFALGTTPDEIAVSIGQRPWRNISPPRDLEKWSSIVRNVVKHCEERFGKTAVESWYWEVWNQPDSSASFQGTQAEYFALYDHTARAVKQANPKARVGGPACRTNAWLGAFAAHLAKSANAEKGEAGVPVDFFSWHVYSTNRGPAAIAALDHSVQEARLTLAAFPNLADKDILLTQWNISPAPNELMDTNYAASFVGRWAERLAKLGVAGSCFFSAADPPWSLNQVFRGETGLVTATDVEKPSLNAFRLLSMLGPTQLAMSVDAEPVNGLATISNDGHRLAVLLSNYVDNPDASYSTEITVRFSGLPFPPGPVHYRRYLVDASRSNAYDAWLTLGRPDRPTALQIRSLRKEAQLRIIQDENVAVTEKGVLIIPMRLPQHSLTLIEVERLSPDQQK